MNYFRCRLADCKKTQKGKLKAKKSDASKTSETGGNAYKHEFSIPK